MYVCMSFIYTYQTYMLYNANKIMKIQMSEQKKEHNIIQKNTCN